MLIRPTSICWPMICTLFLAAGACAAPVEFKFQGTITQATFDPFDPFGGAIAFGTPFVGRFIFDSASPNASADPSTGSYTSTGAPYEMTVNIGGFVFTAADFLNVGVANNFGAGVDQYTVLAQRGTPAGLSDFLALSLLFQDDTGTVFSTNALPLTAPDLTKFTFNTFSLDEQITVDGTLFQFQFQGTVSALTVPEPATLLLLAVGLLGLAVGKRGFKQRESGSQLFQYEPPRAEANAHPKMTAS